MTGLLGSTAERFQMIKAITATCVFSVLTVTCVGLSHAAADERRGGAVDAEAIRRLDSRILTGQGSGDSSQMLARDVQARLRAANIRENAAWAKVTSRALWEEYRDRRLRALRDSLGARVPEP